MSYRVEYEPTTGRKKAGGRRGLGLPGLTALCFLLFVLLVHAFWPQGTEVLRQALWPGDSAVTRQAAETFVEALRGGEPFGAAAEGFCREILEAADIGG